MPQGSILCPILFVLILADLTKVVAMVHLFADDTLPVVFPYK